MSSWRDWSSDVCSSDLNTDDDVSPGRNGALRHDRLLQMNIRPGVRPQQVEHRQEKDPYRINKVPVESGDVDRREIGRASCRYECRARVANNSTYDRSE